MTIAIAPDPRIKVRVDAVCHTCKVRHKIECNPNEFHSHSWEWYAKHDPRRHDVEYYSTDRVLPKGLDERPYEAIDTAPWWLEYKENADIKLAYANSANFSIRPDFDLNDAANGMASSSNFSTGRQSASVDNGTTVKYIDYRIAGKVATGAGTITAASSIRIYAYSSFNDTPMYPDTITGTADDYIALTNAEQLAGLGFLGSTAVTATTNVVYYFGALTSLATVFGIVPKLFGLFVTQNTGSVLNTTQSNHVLSYTGSYFTN